MEFNPVQTNQRPVREKIAQRLWELLRPVVFGCSPWFARKWRVAWLRFASAWYGGGHGASPRVARSPVRRVWIIHGTFPSGINLQSANTPGFIASTRSPLARIAALAKMSGYSRVRTMCMRQRSILSLNRFRSRMMFGLLQERMSSQASRLARGRSSVPDLS